jgi:hypothetical protein
VSETTGMDDLPWTCWSLAPDRHVIELHEALTPACGALEFELLDGGGFVPSYGVWRFSQTGQALALVKAAAA